MSDFFVPGGTMKPGAPSYIERRADDELYDAVLAGEYCTVLTTRQMGKSSLMARTAARLREQAVACATVDLQGKGDKTTPPEQWYYGVAKQIADGLGLPMEWSAWWKEEQMLPPAQRLTDFFADLVLKHIAGPVVVFVDEVDWTIDLPYSDEFFAAIRFCCNRRATDAPFNRLTFVLLGSASPAQLIKSATRTPFNIGRGIELTDFTPEEAHQLATPLGENGGEFLARILYWTDGHPYLTQMLCAKVVEGNGVGQGSPCGPDSSGPQAEGRGSALVDSTVQSTLLSPAARQSENNLKFVGDRLTQGTRDIRRVLRTYRTVLQGKPVKDVPTSPIHTSLRLSGVVKPDAERRLQVRNRVYRQVFNERWLQEKTPSDIRLIVGSAAAVALFAIFSVWYLAIFPQPYIQALETASKDVEVAYKAYDALHKPFHRAQADDLLAQFFERRGDRDEAILLRARTGDGAKLASLVGSDYPSLQRSLRNIGTIESVAYSPDGKLLATGSTDNTARVFEAATGREVSRLAHQNTVSAVAFSPDGKRLATGSDDTIARLFDAATGREIFRFAHRGPVNSVAFSPDNRLLATGSDDRTARVYEASTGREVSRINHGEYVQGVAFGPDSKTLATGSWDGTAHVFEIATSREIFRVRHQNSVYSVVFSSDGGLLATGSTDATARVFEVATSREVSRLEHRGKVWVVAFKPDGKLVATASQDGTARIFEANTGREVTRFNHAYSVEHVAFSPNGELLATGSRDGARVFEVVIGRAVSKAHQDPARSLATSDASTGEDTPGRIRSPDGTLSITQTGNWLHLYHLSGSNWRPIANRHLPVIWANTVRFLPASAHCPRCVEFIRDVPGNPMKLERINFDEYPPPIQGDPKKLLAEWSAKLGLKFDERGHIVPVQP